MMLTTSTELGQLLKFQPATIDIEPLAAQGQQQQLLRLPDTACWSS